MDLKSEEEDPADAYLNKIAERLPASYDTPKSRYFAELKSLETVSSPTHLRERLLSFFVAPKFLFAFPSNSLSDATPNSIGKFVTELIRRGPFINLLL